jgi:hypothetical protein
MHPSSISERGCALRAVLCLMRSRGGSAVRILFAPSACLSPQLCIVLFGHL